MTSKIIMHSLSPESPYATFY